MGILDYLGNPQFSNQLMGLGETLRAIDQSRPANLQPYMERRAEIQNQERMNKMRQKLVEGGLLQRMLQQRGVGPEAFGVLSSALEAAPGAVLPHVLGMAFPQTADPNSRYKVVGGRLVDLAAEGGPGVVIDSAPERTDPYSDIGKLRADLNAGRITPEEYNAKVAKLTSTSGGPGMRFNPETGEFEFTMNAGPGWGSKASNTLDDKIINTADNYARLARIDQMSREMPELLDIGTFPEQLRSLKNWTVEYLGGELSPEEEKRYGDFVAYRGEIRENLSMVLNALSGAAVSPHEEARLKGFLPTDEDGPTVLRRKIQRGMEANAAALARYYMWKKNGGVGTPYEGEGAKTLYEVEREMNATKQQIIAETKKRLEASNLDPSSPEYKALRDNLLREGERKFAEMYGV